MRKNKGFTLVELVVVMAIIAVLVSLALFLINAARLQARNTQRRTNVNTVKGALESYFANYKCYPQTDKNTVREALFDETPTGVHVTGPCIGSNKTWDITIFIPGASRDTVVVDPSADDNRFCYRTTPGFGNS